ncbi:MAG TPA: right-handed parallel beta-helix repeat-containing protein [Candidatus Kapabacteria bacterium]|nr:right-handed parallel beta-helix repeat-containing protein [Candidatus Kapabacteria bacterium]
MPPIRIASRSIHQEVLLLLLIGFGFCLLTPLTASSAQLRPDGYYVSPGDNIQEAIDSAAKNPTNKVVKVMPGTYAPMAKRQALIWFNRSHSGVRVEALGDVTLTAANPELAGQARSAPAVVNHVVYFGDGVGTNTLLKGFRITGANAYVTDKFLKQMEPDETIAKNSFFLTDGGAIKIFGRSYPTLEDLEIEDNYTTPCGGGISIQHHGFNTNSVVLRNCIFRNNRAQVTGSAVDLLEGSAAILINCLFVENASNLGVDVVARRSGEPPFTNSGVLTIFPNSRAVVESCTFTGNRNGVDDMGGLSEYRNSVFHRNELSSGLPGERYELHLLAGGLVNGCRIQGKIIDPRDRISRKDNVLDAGDPVFNAAFVPQHSDYDGVGYRPKKLITRPTQ